VAVGRGQAKVIQTGDITGFLQKVHDSGGERVSYFALRNSAASGMQDAHHIAPFSMSLMRVCRGSHLPGRALRPGAAWMAMKVAS
jgi:hypothetical protein